MLGCSMKSFVPAPCPMRSMVIAGDAVNSNATAVRIAAPVGVVSSPFTVDRASGTPLSSSAVPGVGTGMILVAMPVQTLSIHGSVAKALAIGMVEAAPFVLSTVLALSIGLGRVRIPPGTLLIADCTLRALTFAWLGLLALTDRLTLPVLVAGLLLGATFRMAGSSSRRLLATSLVDDSGRFAVNGLLDGLLKQHTFPGTLT